MADKVRRTYLILPEIERMLQEMAHEERRTLSAVFELAIAGRYARRKQAATLVDASGRYTVKTEESTDES